LFYRIALSINANFSEIYILGNIIQHTKMFKGDSDVFIVTIPNEVKNTNKLKWTLFM